MKPILITLLLIPPILLVVTLGHLWWRRVSRSPATAYQVQRVLFWILLALGPLGVWVFTRLDHPYYLLWVLIAIQWILGVIRGIPLLREYKSRLDSKT